MALPHPALIDLASGRDLPIIEDAWRLLKSAQEHRMTGLLWSRVLKGDIAGTPEWRQALGRQDLLIRATNRQLWETLAEVTASLGELGIEVAALKGVTAEARWYDRLGERPTSDIDLLLAPHCFDRVEELVTLIEPNHRLRSDVQDLVNRGLLDAVVIKTQDGISIDVHLDLLKVGLPSQREVIWSRTAPMMFPNGRSFRVLDPEIAFIHFLVHLNRDLFRHLLGFADIARILTRENLDFGFIQAFTRKEGMAIHHSLSLEIVAETLGLPIHPAEVPRGPRAALWRRVWGADIRLQGDLGMMAFRKRRYWITVMAQRPVTQKLRWVLRQTFPPSPLVDHYHPGRGPYLIRRFGGLLKNDQRARQARRRLGGGS